MLCKGGAERTEKLTVIVPPWSAHNIIGWSDPRLLGNMIRGVRTSDFVRYPTFRSGRPSVDLWVGLQKGEKERE
jgi:hypothetical protein